MLISVEFKCYAYICICDNALIDPSYFGCWIDDSHVIIQCWELYKLPDAMR